MIRDYDFAISAVIGCLCLVLVYRCVEMMG